MLITIADAHPTLIRITRNSVTETSSIRAQKRVQPLFLRVGRMSGPGKSLALNLHDGLAEALAHKGELVALLWKVLSQTLELCGRFESWPFAGFDREGFLDNQVRRPKEEIAIAGGNGWSKLDGQGNRQGHRAHLKVRFVGPKDGLAAFAERLVHAIENGVVLDFCDQHQGRLGKFHWVAARQWNTNRLRTIQSEHNAKLPIERSEDLLPLQSRALFKALGQFVEELLSLRKPGFGDLLLDDRPNERQISVAKYGKRSIGRQQAEAIQLMRLLAKHAPEKSGALALVVVHNRFGMVESFFPSNRTEAEPAYIFDAAALDKVRDDIEGLVQFFVIFGLKIRDGGDQLPPTRDLARNAVEPLLGAQVKVSLSAGIELGRDFLEAVLFGGNGHSRRRSSGGRSGFLLF